MIQDENGDNAVVLQQNYHSANLRALDFNPTTTNLLASGAVNGEVGRYVFSLVIF
jgi:hypothetical protein